MPNHYKQALKLFFFLGSFLLLAYFIETIDKVLNLLTEIDKKDIEIFTNKSTIASKKSIKSKLSHKYIPLKKNKIESNSKIPVEVISGGAGPGVGQGAHPPNNLYNEFVTLINQNLIPIIFL